MYEAGLAGDTLLNPSIVDNVSLLVILHILVHHGPDVRHEAILLDYVVSFIILPYDFTTILKDAPSNDFDYVFI